MEETAQLFKFDPNPPWEESEPSSDRVLDQLRDSAIGKGYAALLACHLKPCMTEI